MFKTTCKAKELKKYSIVQYLIKKEMHSNTHNKTLTPTCRATRAVDNGISVT